jgi:NAD kinase
LCNFEFEEHERVLWRVIFNDFKGDERLDPALDLRMRLKVNMGGEDEEKLRQIYKGTSFNEFDNFVLSDYHVINEVVIDRGPSPYSIQIEIYIDN